MTHKEVFERIAELEDLAAQEVLRLPMSAADIVRYEAAGHVVDLRTGEVLCNGAALRMWPVAAVRTWNTNHIGGEVPGVPSTHKCAALGDSGEVQP